MRVGFTLLAVALLGFASPAHADLTARYASSHPGGPTLSVAVADDGRVRVEAGGRDEVVMITRHGVDYLVARDREGTVVGRPEDFLVIMRERLANEVERPPASFHLLDSISYVIVERGTETVAGRQGAVYAVTMAAGDNRRALLDFVVTTDPELAPVGREISKLIELATGPVLAVTRGWALVERIRELAARGTPLRVGTSFRLEEVSMAPLPESAFELPGPVLDRAALAARIERTGLGRSRRGPPSPPGTVQVPVPSAPPPGIIQVPVAVPAPARDE